MTPREAVIEGKIHLMQAFDDAYQIGSRTYYENPTNQGS